jgi:hypothetical protein
VETISQDRAEPSEHVRAGLKRRQIRPGFEQGVLHQIVGLIAVAAERKREGTKLRPITPYEIPYVVPPGLRCST